MKISKFFCCIILPLVLFTNNALAVNPQDVSLGAGITYSLKASESVLISNPYLWTVSAVCVIKNKDDDNFLTITVTRKQGTLNDQVLKKGDSMTIRLNSKEKMNITANPGAEVELLNIGKKTIVTECTYGF
ncbi:MAG: hypothetical protein P1U74_10020 [Legionellaceae bacterium]|nr:hypothetical protein [Legionellaceae bacterium]